MLFSFSKKDANTYNTPNARRELWWFDEVVCFMHEDLGKRF